MSEEVKKDVWRVSRKLGDFEATLVSFRVGDHTQLAYMGKNGDFNLDVEEAQFLHQSLGALLCCLPSKDEINEPTGSSNPSIDSGSGTDTPRPKSQTTVKPKNAGRRWDDHEDTKLQESFQSGKDIEMLTRTHDRSRGSINARLVKLGLLEDSQK